MKSCVFLERERMVQRRSLIAFLLVFMAGCATTDAGAPKGSRSRDKGPIWTILCLELEGPNRTTDIERFAQSLRGTAGIRGDEVFVVAEGAGPARLYYGKYAWPESSKGNRVAMPEGLRRDLTMIRQLGDPQVGARYFVRAIAVRNPTPDVGNPEWALSNAKGLYTLQVAIFEPAGDFTEFKEAAAEYCKYLREQGHEAYYHHTGAASMVTVGSFGSDAIINPPPRDPRAKPGESIAVATYSPKILQMQQNELLKYNLLNGGIQYVRTPGGRVPVMSRLVEIPHTRSANP